MTSTDRYSRMIERIAELVEGHVPEDGVVLVATGGDGELLRLGTRTALDFPDGVEDRGVTYPSPGLVAIAQLELHRARGADFLLVPAPELWLLDEFPAFERHLRQRYELVADDENVAVLFALRPAETGPTNVWDGFRRTVAECEQALDSDPAILDWRTGLDIREQFPDLPVFTPLADGPTLPYLDGTIDIVAIPASASADEMAEAERVARLAVVTFPDAAAPQEGPGRLGVEWNGFMRKQAARPSIVVPCMGPADLVETFLTSLRDSLRDEEAEVVLAVEGELGAAARWAAEDDRVQLLEMSPGGSLSTACNAAASSVDSELLVFVLPVGCVLPDWLAPLERTFRDHAAAAAVGGRMLTFRGEVLHAGGHVLDQPATGSASRANGPLLACVRAVDYVSPALIATRREAFAELGGFSADHPTTLFVDYSLRLRERGREVLCQPASTLVLPDRPAEFGGPVPEAPAAAVPPVEARR